MNGQADALSQGWRPANKFVDPIITQELDQIEDILRDMVHSNSIDLDKDWNIILKK